MRVFTGMNVNVLNSAFPQSLSMCSANNKKSQCVSPGALAELHNVDAQIAVDTGATCL